jgi:hypothetical protein
MFLMAFCAMIWNSRLSRKARFWRDVAHMDGVRELDELPDGYYQFAEYLGAVGNFFVWRVVFSFSLEGCGASKVLTLVFESRDLAPNLAFTVAVGKIIEANHERLPISEIKPSG